MKKPDRQRLEEVRGALCIGQVKVAECKAQGHKPYKVIHGQDLCLNCLAQAFAAFDTATKLSIEARDPVEEAFDRQERARKLTEIGWAVLGILVLIGICAMFAFFGR